MRSKVRAALNMLEDVLLQGGQDGQDLADLLSALRGPDDGDGVRDPRKEHLTMPLRSMIFPRLWELASIEGTTNTTRSFHNKPGLRVAVTGYFPKRGNACWGMRPPENFKRQLHEDARVSYNGDNHFESHIIRAYEAVKRDDKG